MNRKRGIILLLALSLVASLGFSQADPEASDGIDHQRPIAHPTDPVKNRPGKDGLNNKKDSDKNTNTNNNSDSSNSGSNAGANAVINMESSGARSFIEATPGSTNPGPFPGYTSENGGCRLLHPAAESVLTMNEIRSMASHSKLGKHVRVTVLDANAIQPNDDPIAFVDYNPKAINNPGDKILASIVAPGEFLDPEEEVEGVALLKAKEVSNTRRVGAIECWQTESVTKAHSFGFGISSAGSPGDGSTASAGALGYASGKNVATREDHPVVYIFAMNDNDMLVEPPPPPKPPEPARTETPPQPQAPPVQTIRIEVVGIPPTPQEPPPPPTGLRGTVELRPPVPQPIAGICANKPDIAIHFPFNKWKAADLDQQALSGIQAMGAWLEQNPSCNIDIEGYASWEGGNVYNDNLGEKRAQTVYDILVKNKKIVGQLGPYLSGGKRFATIHSPNTEFTGPDRKVIFALHNVISHPRQ